MIDEKYIISQKKPLIEALAQMNNIGPAPLILFAVDEKSRLVGTLTDGDFRRAVVSGAALTDPVKKVMHRDFHALSQSYDVRDLQRLRQMKLKLIPVLDGDRHIIDIINFDRCKSRLPIDAVIMAGGKGERLRPLTEKTPKPLLKVGDKAIIDYNIDRLLSYGVEHISVTVNYLKEQLEAHFQQPRQGIKIETVAEPMYLGTIGSACFVKKFFHDTVLIMNSDLFTNINFEDFYLHFTEHEADMAAVAVPYSLTVPYGIFDICGEREIKGILEKPTYNYYANAGIYLIKHQMLGQYIPQNTFFNATDFMTKLIEEGRKVIRFPLSGYWIDIGNKQEYAKAQDIANHL